MLSNVNQTIKLLVASGCCWLALSWPAWSLALEELVGNWNNDTTFESVEIRQNGDVIDNQLGQGRIALTSDNAANITFVFHQGAGQSQIQQCWYFATLMDTGHFRLAVRNGPNTSPQCQRGSFTKLQHSIPESGHDAETAQTEAAATEDSKKAQFEDAKRSYVAALKSNEIFKSSKASEEVFNKIRAAAAGGDCYAKVTIASFYESALAGIEKDYQRAESLYRSAMKKGCAGAYGELASMLQGIEARKESYKPFNADEALSLYRNGASLNDWYSKVGLGNAYKYAWFGLKEDGEEACRLYRSAGPRPWYKLVDDDQDSALGWCYIEGIGGGKDIERGIEAFKNMEVSCTDFVKLYNTDDYGMKDPTKAVEAVLTCPAFFKIQHASFLSPEAIKLLERRLQEMDLYHGPIDGVMGPKLIGAIEALH